MGVEVCGSCSVGESRFEEVVVCGNCGVEGLRCSRVTVFEGHLDSLRYWRFYFMAAFSAQKLLFQNCIAA